MKRNIRICVCCNRFTVNVNERYYCNGEDPLLSMFAFMNKELPNNCCLRLEQVAIEEPIEPEWKFEEIERAFKTIRTYDKMTNSICDVLNIQQRSSVKFLDFVRYVEANEILDYAQKIKDEMKRILDQKI